MKRLQLLAIFNILLLSSCARVPDDLMSPNQETLKIRTAQSRTFDARSDRQLLQASIAVLQDMGYSIKESSSEYGVLTGVKEASARSTGQVILAIATALLGGKASPIDETQHITATMVVLDKDQDDKAMARTVFQRIVVRTDGSKYHETLTDQNIYTEFYEKLDKALFLEINSI